MKNKSLAISIAVFFIFAIVFAIFDWQISEALFNPAAKWAHFMEAFGQVPGALLGLVSGHILLRTYKTEKKIKSIAGLIGLYLLTILMTLGFYADLLGAQVDPDNINFALLIGLVIGTIVIGQIVLYRIPVEVVTKYKNSAKAGLSLAFLAGIITVWVFKIPWGRWTYRDILDAGNPALFTPWYLPQGNNGHHSFFSGHTAMSFVVLGWMLSLGKENKYRNLALGIFILWGIIGGLSRIVVGAHFASDVLFGAGETLLWFWFLRKKFTPELMCYAVCR